MVGYMNDRPMIKTREEKKITFFSRSKKQALDQRINLRGITLSLKKSNRFR